MSCKRSNVNGLIVAEGDENFLSCRVGPEHIDETAVRYNREVLAVLMYEFDENDRADCERKLKRRLREKALGRFDPNRIALLRRFKDEVRYELDDRRTSTFFRGDKGRVSRSEHWDQEGLYRHFEARFPEVSPEIVHGFVQWGIYIYWLRERPPGGSA